MVLLTRNNFYGAGSRAARRAHGRRRALAEPSGALPRLDCELVSVLVPSVPSRCKLSNVGRAEHEVRSDAAAHVLQGRQVHLALPGSACCVAASRLHARVLALVLACFDNSRSSTLVSRICSCFF
jgi:hypothetical protein